MDLLEIYTYKLTREDIKYVAVKIVWFTEEIYANILSIFKEYLAGIQV